MARHDLKLADDARGGDYRKLSEQAWNLYKKFYPKSGPTITAKFDAVSCVTGMNSDVAYPASYAMSCIIW